MNPLQETPLSRRNLLKRAGCGFGYLALADLLSQRSFGAAATSPLAEKAPHHPPRAKRIIFLFMHGGPSQVDSFDYKPLLEKEHGKNASFKQVELASVGATSKVMKSPWTFKRHGESGIWASDLFPHTVKHIDDLCLINSMHTEGQSHGQAVLNLHTGSDIFTRPSVGSWITYGLGTENQDLPGFITISPPTSHGGVQNYGTAFLPAAYQGTAIGSAGTPVAQAGIRNVVNKALSRAQQRKQLDLIQSLNRSHAERAKEDSRLDAVIESYELAFRMQTTAPDVLDMSGESKETLALYGIDQKETAEYGRQCLLARRFAESGVRYIQVSTKMVWDQHGNLESGHRKNALSVDKPIGGLLEDLKRRGLLDDTLVLWGGEFGRTPLAQGSNGRDHCPQGFTMWLAGAGVKKGHVHGKTDEYGYYAIEDKVHMHDLHATLLWLLGLDHERLTYRHAGRDFRLTDVHGRIVNEIFA
ncbi:hypothetical protein Pan216_25940 [Planctomycetes bacterium Pan216]|uniref:Sulfatase n=1 Tax=Kolteria novifilia TaxID=2527975 RepID=A0A518B417_9BACT|nr:hypothetical protein Pan216_25940 [Planctomycetes bacterium Pan216]